jgi:hypothetical protein
VGTGQNKVSELLVHYNNNGWKMADGRRIHEKGKRAPSNCGDPDSSNNIPGSDPFLLCHSAFFPHYSFFLSGWADNMHDTNFALFSSLLCVYVFLGGTFLARVSDFHFILLPLSF